MKKIISLFVLLFAFSFSVNAQEKMKESPEMSAKKDIVALTNYIQLDSQISESLYGLLLYKHNAIAGGVKEEKEREELAMIIGKKLEATLSAEQFKKLNSNKELLNKLTH